MIRGLSPYPAAWSNLVNKKTGEEIFTKVFYAQKTVVENQVEAGSIETDGKKYLNVACQNGWLQIIDLQISGKRRMKTEEFLRGFQQIGEYHFQ